MYRLVLLFAFVSALLGTTPVYAASTVNEYEDVVRLLDLGYDDVTTGRFLYSCEDSLLIWTSEDPVLQLNNVWVTVAYDQLQIASGDFYPEKFYAVQAYGSFYYMDHTGVPNHAELFEVMISDADVVLRRVTWLQPWEEIAPRVLAGYLQRLEKDYSLFCSVAGALPDSAIESFYKHGMFLPTTFAGLGNYIEELIWDMMLSGKGILLPGILLALLLGIWFVSHRIRHALLLNAITENYMGVQGMVIYFTNQPASKLYLPIVICFDTPSADAMNNSAFSSISESLLSLPKILKQALRDGERTIKLGNTTYGTIQGVTTVEGIPMLRVELDAVYAGNLGYSPERSGDMVPYEKAITARYGHLNFIEVRVLGESTLGFVPHLYIFNSWEGSALDSGEGEECNFLDFSEIDVDLAMVLAGQQHDPELSITPMLDDEGPLRKLLVYVPVPLAGFYGISPEDESEEDEDDDSEE